MRITLTVLLVLIADIVLAQGFRSCTHRDVQLNGAFGMSPDTIGLAVFMTDTPTLYMSPNGGYAFGNNNYGDVQKAQTYVLGKAKLKGVVLGIGAKHVGSAYPDSSFIEVLVYNQGGLGYLENQTLDSLAGPDSVVAYTTVNFGDLPDSGLVYFDLSWENLSLNDTFTFAVRFTEMQQGDTIGLISTLDGANGGIDLAWEMNAWGEWVKVSNDIRSWGLDVNLAIFPVVEPTAISVSERLPGHIYIYPNPTTGLMRLSGADGSRFELTDAMGKRCLDGIVPLGGQLDLSNFADGLYTVRVIAVEGSWTARLSLRR